MEKENKIFSLLTRGVAEVIDREHLRKQLSSGKKLRVKLGIDPTSPNIHIGRAVVLWKLRAFQELGHKVVFIVGDFTGLIGDTSDKEAERKMMSETEIKKNLKTYFKQTFKILDETKTETHYNSKWLKDLDFKEIGKLADLFGLHEFESRENIAKRLKAGKRVSVRELLYPLMQGYDSVAVRADVELGGTDQKFNLLAGRKIQRAYGQNEQDVMTTQLLEGTDGRKMSSSWGNVVNLIDTSDEMFGKLMSVPDDLIKKYFLLATDLQKEEINIVLKGNSNPRDQKLILAETITRMYHGAATSKKARQNFEIKFGKDKDHSKITADITVKISTLPKKTSIAEALVSVGLANSKSDARRKILEGAVELDGRRIDEPNEQVQIKPGGMIRLGKRFVKLI